MVYPASKNRELSAQLAIWWTKQTDFKTKKMLAERLEIHPDTLGDYFSGRKFPRPDIASKLGYVTGISCLNSYAGATSFSDVALPVSPGVPLLLPAGAVVTSTEQHHNERRSGENAEVSGRQPPLELMKKAEGRGHEAVVISLQRTRCPFCEHSIAGFQNCVHCGQHFVWANVPIAQDDSSRHNDLWVPPATGGDMANISMNRDLAAHFCVM